MIVAHVIVTILACCVSLSLTELATAFPFSSSFVTYANAAFGGGVASFVGYAYTIEILILQTVPTLAIAQIVSEIFGANSTLQPFIWIVTIIFAMLLNYKPAILIKTSIAFSAISVLILIICFSITGSHILFNEAFSVSSNANFTSSITSLEPPSNFLPFGIQGVIEAIPYALYLVICYEAIQALPEEIIHPNTDIKIGMFVAIPCTVMPLSWIALMLFSSLPPGIQDIEVAFLPLTDAFTSIFGMNIESGKLFHLLSLPSILVAQSCIFMASTRFIYGLSRGGFLPSSISLTTSRGNPHVAITINAFGSLIICAVQLFGGVETSTIFIKIGTTFALIAYCADSLIFIRLRYKMPTLPRPFASPLGVAGGYIASAISIFTLGGLVYLDIVFRYSFLAACLFFVFCIPIYFYIIKRNLKENL